MHYGIDLWFVNDCCTLILINDLQWNLNDKKYYRYILYEHYIGNQVSKTKVYIIENYDIFIFRSVATTVKT